MTSHNVSTHKLVYEEFYKMATTVEHFHLFSEQLNALGSINWEIKYSVGMLYQFKE